MKLQPRTKYDAVATIFNLKLNQPFRLRGYDEEIFAFRRFGLAEYNSTWSESRTLLEMLDGVVTIEEIMDIPQPVLGEQEAGVLRQFIDGCDFEVMCLVVRHSAGDVFRTLSLIGYNDTVKMPITGDIFPELKLSTYYAPEQLGIYQKGVY